ncbi:MAG: hypothetical protein WDZ91_12300 [Paenibacillaceae bacterium]
MKIVFYVWKQSSTQMLKDMQTGVKPKSVIFELSENLLTQYTNKILISKYDVYQHLMDYWSEVMQDDCYIISIDGWKAETYRIQIVNKQKKVVDKGWTCDLVPKELVINRYFAKEKQAIEVMEAESETVAGQLIELEEEHSGEEGYFADLDKVSKGNIQARLKQIHGNVKDKEEIQILKSYLALTNKLADTNKEIKEASVELDHKLYAKYPTLTVDEIKTLVVDDKWMATIENEIHTEMDRISQRLTQRIKELAERYEIPMPKLMDEVRELEQKVNAHLERMGFVWN